MSSCGTSYLFSLHATTGSLAAMRGRHAHRTSRPMNSLDTILTFMTQIELSVSEGEVSRDSFLPGVRVARGTLVFDRALLRWPGDLLHEAGHVAVTPARLR